MGWFSSFCSGVVSGVKSAASVVSRGVSKAWGAAKSVAGKAIGWMADKAEGFINTAKEIYGVVKPFIQKNLLNWIKAAEMAAPWPWVRVALNVLHKGLTALTALENSPVLKKAENAITWCIKAARVIKDKFLTPEEMLDAEERKRTLDEVASNLQGDERKSIELTALINDYLMIKTAIKQTFETDNIKGFDHYLRLRATQKLLLEAERVFEVANDITDITSDDTFLIKIGSDLLQSDPVLSDDDTIRLDEIVVERFGKKLIPFVFEEMIFSWNADVEVVKDEWNNTREIARKDKLEIQRLEIEKDVASGLSLEDEQKLLSLKESVSIQDRRIEHLGIQKSTKDRYVSAAEGFLQALELEENELEEKGQFPEDVQMVGEIIIDCAQNERTWDSLSQEQQELLTDYANIYEKDRKKRVKKLVEVMV